MSLASHKYRPEVQTRKLAHPFNINSFTVTTYRVALTELGGEITGSKADLWRRLIEWPDRAAVLHALKPQAYR